MRIIILFIIFCSPSCSVSKKYNQYIGHTKDYLISLEGTPAHTRTDSLMNETLVYYKNIKNHNPKYLSVTEIVVFYVNNKGEVYKYDQWKDKETPPTPKPKAAMY